MVAAPERIWAYHNGNSQTYLTALNKFHNVEYLRADIAERQIAELRAELSGLLARIHRDGGHYETDHGTSKAVADADAIVANLYSAEAENARLRALPLKDEVERVLEDIANSDDVDNALDPARNKRVARALLSRLRAGEQEGWRLVPKKPTEQIVTAISRFVRERAIPVADDDDPDAVYFDYGHARALYHAILAATPSDQGGDRG